MRKRGADPILQKSSRKSKSTKKSRELKDLGPTLEELVPRYNPAGTDSDEEEDWKQNRLTYSSDEEDDTPSPEEEAEHRRQSRTYAETGLQYYNKKNGTNYELVDALDHVMFLDRAVCVHCNFTAKPQMKPDAQAQLFFAEMHYSDSLPKRLIVATCRRLLKSKTDGCQCQSCGGPRSTIIHPTNGFRWGYYEHLGRTLRSRA